MRNTHTLRAAAVLAAMSIPTSAFARDAVEECYDYVLTTCADAMADSNFIERVALGIVCSAMLVGCNTTIEV